MSGRRVNSKRLTLRWRSGGLLLCGLLSTADADPVEEYKQACEAPFFDHLSTIANPSLEEENALIKAAWSVSDDTCLALVDRLAAVADPVPETRLALHLARDWLGEYGESDDARCDEVRVIAEELSGHPDVLYELSHCTDTNSERASLLQKVLMTEPRHQHALRSLTGLVSHAGDAYGMDAETLIRHGNTLYEVAMHVDHKVSAAVFIHQTGNDASNHESGEVIRQRLRRDLGLDALDYGLAGRAGSLRRVCSFSMFKLGFEGLCVSAFETLVEESLATGLPIPDDVLRQLEQAYEDLRYGPWRMTPKTGAANHLKALLDTHPESLRSSEYHRVHAETAAVWRDRIALLRRAVDLDYGNLRARCDLAEALAATGARSEAGAVYLDLMSSGSPPCKPGRALRSLDEQSLWGTNATIASPEDPVEFIILR